MIVPEADEPLTHVRRSRCRDGPPSAFGVRHGGVPCGRTYAAGPFEPAASEPGDGLSRQSGKSGGT